jgi:NAD(P)-dependent dehydrogenase (short-subunit alcohol dehydrogenase family)
MVDQTWPKLLEGRSALVTGSGAGMGRAIAIFMARAGAEVWVADVNRERASGVVERIEEEGGKAHVTIANVRDPESIAAMAEESGPVDILVNNAGSGVRAYGDSGLRLVTFAESDPADWQPYLELDLLGVMHVTHRYLPAMIERGWGRIVTIVSDAGRKGERRQVAYGAAKAGAMGFIRGLAAEVGRYGVTANCIALGTMKHGGAMQSADPESEKKILRNYAVGRLGHVADPAPLAVLLCSDAGEWITGQVYPVNGGYTSSL